MTLRGYRPDDLDPVTGQKFYEVCSACNYDKHRCGGCGAELLHGEECCSYPEFVQQQDTEYRADG